MLAGNTEGKGPNSRNFGDFGRERRTAAVPKDRRMSLNNLEGLNYFNKDVFECFFSGKDGNWKDLAGKGTPGGETALLKKFNNLHLYYLKFFTHSRIP